MKVPVILLEWYSRYTRPFAIFLIAFSGLLITLSNLLAQLILAGEGGTLSAVQLLLLLYLLEFPFVVATLIVKQIPLFETLGNLGLLLSMGAFVVLDALAAYKSLELIPVADFTTVMMTRPLFTFLLSFITRRENLSLTDLGCGVASFLGVIIMCKPSFIFDWLSPETATEVKFNTVANTTSDFEPAGSPTYLLGIGFAILASIAHAANTVLMKWSGTKYHLLLTIFYPIIASVVLLPMYMVATGERFIVLLSFGTWSTIIWMTTVSFFGCMITAETLLLESATRSLIVRNLDIVYAFILQIAFMNVMPTWSTVAGSLVVVLATTLLTFKRQKDEN